MNEFMDVLLLALLGAGAALLLPGIIIDEILGGFADSDAADNEREVQRKNQEAWDAYRRQSLEEFRKSRGSEGNAFLPLYFGSGNQSFEKRLADDYKSFYGSLPKVNANAYQEQQQKFMPMIDAAGGALGDVYNGNLMRARLGYLQPVNQARTAAARGNQQAIFEGLAQRINALNAQNAQKGFSGTGSFAQNRLLGSTIGARQAAANVMSAADLANAEATRGVYDESAMLKLQMMNEPFRQASNAMAYMDMPTRAAVAQYMERLRPLDAFRIGTAMPNLVAPMPEAAIPTDSQIWLNRGANIANNIGQVAMGAFTGGLGGMLPMGGGGAPSNGSFAQQRSSLNFGPPNSDGWDY